MKLDLSGLYLQLALTLTRRRIGFTVTCSGRDRSEMKRAARYDRRCLFTL